MARRRAEGEETIVKRPDGRWEGKLSLGRGSDGRRRRHVVYGRERNEVVDALVVNAPKSERGARVVAVPPVCVDALRRRRQA